MNGKFFSFFLPEHPMRSFTKKILLLSLLFHLLCAFFNVGYDHPDEYFQVMEFASAKMNITPAHDLAWEYSAGIRPALQPAMVVGMCKVFHLSNPVIISFVLRLLSSLFAWLVTTMFILLSLSHIQSVKLKKVVLVLSLLFWFVPYLHGRFSSENWTAIFFFAGLSMLLYYFRQAEEKKEQGLNQLQLLLSGIFLGLAFDVRFQTGIMIAGLGLWLVIFRKLNFLNVLVLFSGIMFSFFAGVLIDHWFYNKWILTPLNYFHVNILEGKTADWGTSPWWEYFKMIFINTIPPFSILVLLGIILFFIRNPKHMLSWITIPFLLVHIINGHKELRFLFPLLNVLPLVVVMAIEGEKNKTWFKKIADPFSHRSKNIFVKIFLVVNAVLLLIVSFRPSNENFSFYDFVYANYFGKEIRLYTASGNPYVVVGLPVVFFRPKKLDVIEIQNDSSFSKTIFGNQSINLFLTKNYSVEQPAFLAGKNARLVYENVPGWIRHFNFNNWLKRTRSWQVYEFE